MAFDSVILSIFVCCTRCPCVVGNACSSNQRSDARIAYWVCVSQNSPSTSASLCCSSATIFQSRRPALSSARSCLNADSSGMAHPRDEPVGLRGQVPGDVFDSQLAPQERQRAFDAQGGADL